jgi:phosphonate C-P lyase system protein PhnG
MEVGITESVQHNQSQAIVNTMKKLSQIQIQQALIHADETLVNQLFDRMMSLPIEIPGQPEVGLVMMKALDSCQEEFYLGEVLVTQAELKYKDYKGYSMIIGDNKEKALCLAALEAVMQGDEKGLIDDLNKLLWKAWIKAENEIKQENSLSASTRVNFENMAEEDYLTK